MKTKEFNARMESPKRLQPQKSNLQTILSILFNSLVMIFAAFPASAHCDTESGPTVVDALKHLKQDDLGRATT